MKKFFILTIAMISLFMFSEKSRASLLIEPYFGSHLNSTAEIGSEDGDATGTAMGARLGYQNLGLMLGLNLKKGSFKLKGDSSSADYNYTQYGAFIGYDFPILLRVWGEFLIGGSSTSDDDSKAEYTTITGTQLGIGYKLMPFVSLNLEIGTSKWDDYEYDGTAINSSVDLSTYFLSISFPITL